MNTIQTQLEKTKSHAFGKDVYLLGTDAQGVKYWLESPSWDCGWYWGFGYIQTYVRNQMPDRAKDIDSHEHAENFLSEWFTEWNNSTPRLSMQTFSSQEGWELSELFAQFYFLKSAAENFGRGKCYVANTSAPNWEKKDLVKEINEKLIPAVTARIIEILTPVTN